MAKIIEDRDNRILNAAIELAEEDSYQWITREQVAERAGVATGTINTVYGTMADLKRAVLRAAIERSNLPIIAEAAGAGHPIMLQECPAELRAKAVSRLLLG